MAGDRRHPRARDGDHRPDGDAGAIDRAVQALRTGDLAILPTETVYGLAADAANSAAVARLFAAKGRPRFNPLIAHLLDVAAAGVVSKGPVSAPVTPVPLLLLKANSGWPAAKSPAGNTTRYCPGIKSVNK